MVIFFALAKNGLNWASLGTLCFNLDTRGHYRKCTENRGLKVLSPLFSAQYSSPLALEPKKVPRIVEIIDNREVTSLLFRRKLPLTHHWLPRTSAFHTGDGQRGSPLDTSPFRQPFAPQILTAEMLAAPCGCGTLLSFPIILFRRSKEEERRWWRRQRVVAFDGIMNLQQIGQRLVMAVNVK